MHHVVVESWSRADSPLHRREARVKLVLLLAFLAALGTMPRLWPPAVGAYAALLAAAIAGARLPAISVAARGALVLPFTVPFVLFTLLDGDGARAASFLVKSYLSAVAVLVTAGTTPLPELMRGLEGLRTPRFLVLVAQFVYRYLFVISEQAQHMRLAAASRGGGRPSWRAAAGAISVLFARSYARAQGIHSAMLARGFDGRTPSLSARNIGTRDALLLAAGLCAVIVVRLACPR